jgi:excisionase family DNA binding protein
MSRVSDLTDTEVARALRIHLRTVQRWCRRGQLPGAYKAGRAWRIPHQAVREIQLGHIRSDDPTMRELRAAREACQDLRHQLTTLNREPGTHGLPAERNWPALAVELRQLERALDGLADLVGRLPHPQRDWTARVTPRRRPA